MSNNDSWVTGVFGVLAGALAVVAAGYWKLGQNQRRANEQIIATVRETAQRPVYTAISPEQVKNLASLISSAINDKPKSWLN